jgi:ion channel
LIGAAVSGGNHAMVVVIVIWVTRRVALLTLARQSFGLIAVMISAVLVLMVGHFVEVLVWSLTYAIAGAAPDGTDFVYFAFVNNTTLGYGDVICGASSLIAKSPPRGNIWPRSCPCLVNRPLKRRSERGA